MAAQPPSRDLVVVALPGVQRLISEARSTADVQAGSAIIAHLAAAAARSIQEQGGELVIPHQIGELDGMPNRVVALAPDGRGEPVAERAAGVVQQEWRTLLGRVFESVQPSPTPGMPMVLWVCVADDGRGYGWQWERAQALLTGRRRVRDFTEPQEWSGRPICTLSPRWPAENVSPPNLKPHEQATLSATNWVRRRWQHIQHTDRFPSTPSIASAPFRHEVLKRPANREIHAAITALHQATSQLGLPGERRFGGYRYRRAVARTCGGSPGPVGPGCIRSGGTRRSWLGTLDAPPPSSRPSPARATTR